MRQKTLIRLMVMLTCCVSAAVPVSALDVLMVPLGHPVYTVLEMLEAGGSVPLQPMAKPYTKRYIVNTLRDADARLEQAGHPSPRRQEIVREFIREFTDSPTGGNELIPVISDSTDSTDTADTAENTQKAAENTKKPAPLILGLNFTSDTHAGLTFIDQTNEPTTQLTNQQPNDPTTQQAASTSNLLEAVMLGGLGEDGDISYRATLGVALDRLAPDLFYKSYTKDGEVHFPYGDADDPENNTYKDLGYAFLPYQFTYDTVWWHANARTYQSDQSALSEDFHYGFRYLIEGTGVFFDDALTAGFHNLRRAWGHSTSNLLLSEHARRFPGVELHLRPTDWASYSYLTGSLFNFPAAQKSFAFSNVDLGIDQKNYTVHSIEVRPLQAVSAALSAANVWPKRNELSYQLPFILPFFMQLQDMTADNLSVELDIAARVPYVGKFWFSFFIDEMSFDITENLLRMPRNRYAYQAGLRFAVPENILPMTQLSFQYTRLTPFVYTHHPVSDIPVYVDRDGNIRPVDVTFTHDGFNLGFYLPPNSDELHLTIDHVVSRELQLSLTGKLIRHGTNDLAHAINYENGDELYVFGDIYQYQVGGVNNYPLSEFLHDGIYDWTAEAELMTSWRPSRLPFSLEAGIGFARTWWEANESGITEPDPRNMWTGSLAVTL